ncbi:MAG TPA: lipase family protein [Candidatus Angelobacter sp.]|nr:lipase family protein [Candidatus Angelobacter sp.]
MATAPFAFTPLVEPTSNVTPTPPPAPFNPVIAYLLGQCCNLTYIQFDAGLNWSPDFSSLELTGYTIAASNAHTLSVFEAIEPGPTAGDIGDYVQVPAGFVVQLALTPAAGGQTQTIMVVALRGTRTWEEWFDDADGFPTPFAGVGELSIGLGTVHAGFYGLYTNGTDGLTVSNPLNSQWNQRASGSIAYQIGQYISPLNNSLPLYVTGHSLGGAVATLCALDIAYNFGSNFSQLFMYSLASPRVAAGLSDIPTLDNQEGFLSRYQFYVPNTYRIVHAADIIPILGPTSTTLGPLTLNFAHVTDAYQGEGSGALASASISGGAVTSVTITNDNYSGYSSSFPPSVQFSGGGGTGAVAVASVSIFGTVTVTVTNGGSGYASAPSVQINSNGSLAQNVVNFCAQTGDIGMNHACAFTYVPYLQQLASNFTGPVIIPQAVRKHRKRQRIQAE